MGIPILSRSDSAALAMVLLAVFSLSACGGGGGSSPSANTPTVSPPASTSTPTTPLINNQVEPDPPYGSFAAQDEDPDNFSSLVASAETEEYNGMGGLALINASSAYARGATGEGVSVGVIDSGVYEEHFEFATASGDKVEYAGSNYNTSSPRTSSAVKHGTQVASVIAANKDGDLGTGFKMHGVAYNADILDYEIPLGSGAGPYKPLDETTVGFNDDNYFANLFTDMSSQVDIINMSFGFSGVVTSYSAASIENAFGTMVDALRQQNNPRGNRALFVISTGNAWGDVDEFDVVVDATSPEILPGIPYLFPELQDHMLAVAAVDSSGKIAFYSNHCGVAADFCLVAPGGGDANNDGTYDDDEVIWAATSPPEDAEEGRDYYGDAIGTSFAAPVVSGSLALLKELFPSVGNYELANRLLVTANKDGIYADSSIYGQGLLNLDAATRPVGDLSVATGISLDSGMQSAAQSNISGGALGTSLANALSGNTVALFDNLGFPFYQSANNLVTASAKRTNAPTLRHSSQQSSNGTKISLGSAPDLWQQDEHYNGTPKHQVQPDYIALQFQNPKGIERFAGINANPGWFFGVYGDSILSPSSTHNDSSFAAPWLGFARHGWSSGGALPLGDSTGKLRVGLFNGNGTASWDNDQPVSAHRGSGAVMEYAVSSDRSSLSLQTGFVREEDTFLGTEIGIALGTIDSSDTFFAGLNGHVQLSPQWQGLVALYSGTTDSGLSQTGQLQLPNNITSSSWAMGFKTESLWRGGDQFTVYLSQPLRIESGRGELQLATGRTPDRQVVYENIAFDLQPQGREQQLEINYRRPWTIIDHKAWFSASAEYTHEPNHSAGNAINNRALFSSQFEMRLRISIAIY